MVKELIVLRDLSDDELLDLSDDELFELRKEYEKKGVPVRATVKGLLDELEIKYDDLTDFIQNLEVGICNNANRTKDHIYINRKNSPLKDNILINLNDNYDMPDVTIQIHISEDFVHEEAYNEDGLLIYQA